jgi:hypothetical protein
VDDARQLADDPRAVQPRAPADPHTGAVEAEQEVAAPHLAEQGADPLRPQATGQQAVGVEPAEQRDGARAQLGLDAAGHHQERLALDQAGREGLAHPAGRGAGGQCQALGLGRADPHAHRVGVLQRAQDLQPPSQDGLAVAHRQQLGVGLWRHLDHRPQPRIRHIDPKTSVSA